MAVRCASKRSAVRSATLTVIAQRREPTANTVTTSDWGNAQSWAPYTYDYFYRALSARRSAQPGSCGWHRDDATGSGRHRAGWSALYALDIDEQHQRAQRGEFTDPDLPEYSGIVR